MASLGKVVSGTLLTIVLLSVTKFFLLPFLLSPNSAIPAWIPLSALLALLVPFLVSNSQKFTNLPPGPLSLPVFGNWLQVGNDLNHRFLASLAAKYGSVFLLRLGVRNLVVVSDPQLATEVLHTQGVEFGSRPRNVVFDIFTGNGQDMAFTVYGDHWRKMRRIMTLPFFANKVVAQYREMWEQEMDAVVEDLKEAGGEWAKAEGVVVRRRLQLMLYNIMYRMMFDAVSDPLFLQATQFNSERSRLVQGFEYNYGHFIPILRRVNKRSSRNLRSRSRWRHAAIETMLWSMEWAIAELVNHPAVQAKLRRELADVLGGAPLTESTLPRLQAVVKETLRQHTPIPLLVPHMNLEQAKLGSHDIPKESKVVVNAWWLVNNPTWWKDPAEFRPERFFEEERDTAAVAAGKVDFRYLPFGVGRLALPRDHPGAAVAGARRGEAGGELRAAAAAGAGEGGRQREGGTVQPPHRQALRRRLPAGGGVRRTPCIKWQPLSLSLS